MTRLRETTEHLKKIILMVRSTMKRRERLLAAMAGALMLLLAAWFVLNRLVLAPAALLDRQAKDLDRRIGELLESRTHAMARQAWLQESSRETLGRDPEVVSEQIRSRLAKLIQAAGIGTEALSLTPVTNGGVAGAYHEVGWLVHVRARDEQAVRLLSMLEREPYWHSVNQIAIETAGPDKNLNIRFRFSTISLVLRDDVPAVTGVPLAEQPLSKSFAEQGAYAVIAQRRLFDPAPPPIPEAAVAATAPHPPSPPPEPADDLSTLRIVGLPTWDGTPEVLVFDSTKVQLLRLNLNDELARGTIVGVEYHPAPRSDNTNLVSHSRVIIRFDDAEWAIDLGHTLAQKRPLDASVENDQTPLRTGMSRSR
jgi:hypothetical protein